MVQEGLQDRQNAIRRRPALTASVIAVRGFLGSRTDGVGFRVHPLRPGGMLVTPAQNSFGGEIFDQHGAEFRQDGVDDGLLGIAFGARPFLRIECFEIVACYVADGVGACLDHPVLDRALPLPPRARLLLRLPIVEDLHLIRSGLVVGQPQRGRLIGRLADVVPGDPCARARAAVSRGGAPS